ncbi:MAG TPA: fused MFS/spermidine synthase [Bryobacteraceae bacterium]|nr:fused MFS/spermidine synthase [Bryobacteraceae bacterium]
MTLYAVTIFLSAFLLFQVQPLIAKIILPWFGGSAAVWAAALLFFQLVLLAGYAYSHAVIRYAKPKGQMMIHAALLAVSCAALPILPSPSWKPSVAGDPTLQILALLAATIGLPYFILSSTSPLLQAWYVRRSGTGMPYRLFALSNFGSMLALVSFPFLVEPAMTSRQQAFTWSGAYIVFALLCVAAAWRSREGHAEAHTAKKTPRPPLSQLVLWVALAACASTLLVAVTNHLSQNVAPIPLLWVVPLALYLLTFIFAFESDRIYQRWWVVPLAIPAIGAMAYMIWVSSGNLDIQWMIPGFCLGLFLCCMMCHGELARRRPAPDHLTLFYLMVSLGGALGGIFVALIAPRVFKDYLELEVGLAVCAVLAAVVLWNLDPPWIGKWPLRTALVIAAGMIAGYMIRMQRLEDQEYRLMARNFYGVLRVSDDKVDGYNERELLHGTINHGEEVLDGKMRYVPVSYYGEDSGVGRAIRAAQGRGGPVRVGVIGLGAGVLSTYGRAGDYYRIYEINPLVPWIAQTQFYFYPHSPADKAILLGDARLTLERQPTQNFDVLAVDAFSSDAIPIHLLTRQAIGLYLKQLQPDGILALHISNRYLNLEPVCARGAEAYSLTAMVVDDDGETAGYMSASTWVLLTRRASWFDTISFRGADMHAAKAPPGFREWTDDYSNVFRILSLKSGAD